jgi:hypothetical protein
MDTLIFSQTAIFRMQQLASCVYQKTGIRHRMATQEGMLSLLNEAGSSSDRDIRLYYDAFVRELNKRQLDILEERNVKIRPPSSSMASGIRKAS